MGFKHITIQRFRAFSDLTVRGIPDTARLIVLVGPNGCGKSSLLDALYVRDEERVEYWTAAYHQKYTSLPGLYRRFRDSEWPREEDSEERRRNLRREVYDRVQYDPNGRHNRFYLRSAHRNEAELQASPFSHPAEGSDGSEVHLTMDNDGGGRAKLPMARK